MAVFVPIRIVTMVAGLIGGYYFGAYLENKIEHKTFMKSVQKLMALINYEGLCPSSDTIGDDEIDDWIQSDTCDCPLCDSDEDTEYSE